MTSDFNCTHTFTYTFKDPNPPLKIYDGSLKDQNVVISSDDNEMTVYQLFNLFKSYVLSVGYCEKSFYDACKFYAEEGED